MEDEEDGEVGFMDRQKMSDLDIEKLTELMNKNLFYGFIVDYCNFDNFWH